MDITKEWRLMYINYGLKEAQSRFLKNLEQKQNSLDIVASLSELVIWINISDEWHFRNNKKGYKKRKLDSIGGKYIEGLRYASNSIKHEMSFIKLIRPIGHKSFIEGHYQVEDYSTDSIWVNLDKLIPNRADYIEGRKNYQTYIEGKTVVETINQACSFLYGEYTKLKNSQLESI